MSEQFQTPDFDLQRRLSERRRKRAEAMLTRGGEQPTGQMVGRHYVAPSVLQHLVPVANQVVGQLELREADRADAESADAERRAVREWQSSLPSATQAPAVRNDDDGNAMPEVPKPRAQHTKELTQHYINALRFPSIRKPVEGALDDLIIDKPSVTESGAYTRARGFEPNPAWVENRQAQQSQRQAELAYREADAIRRSEDARASIEARREAAAEAAALRRELAQMAASSRAADRDLRRDLAEARRTPANDGRPLPPNVVSKLADQASMAESTERFVATFSDDYSGLTGEVSRAAGAYSPIATTNARKTAEWWNDYQAHKNTVRHSLFGAALTATERGEWEKSDINPSMRPEQIRKNLQRRAELERRAYDKLARTYAAGGYSRGQIDATAPARPPTTGGATGEWGESGKTIDFKDLK